MRRRPTRLVGLLILVAIVATGAVVVLALPRIGTQQIDQARATTLAREFFATASATSGMDAPSAPPRS